MNTTLRTAFVDVLERKTGEARVAATNAIDNWNNATDLVKLVSKDIKICIELPAELSDGIDAASKAVGNLTYTQALDQTIKALVQRQAVLRYAGNYIKSLISNNNSEIDQLKTSSNLVEAQKDRLVKVLHSKRQSEIDEIQESPRLYFRYSEIDIRVIAISLVIWIGVWVLLIMIASLLLSQKDGESENESMGLCLGIVGLYVLFNGFGDIKKSVKSSYTKSIENQYKRINNDNDRVYYDTRAVISDRYGILVETEVKKASDALRDIENHIQDIKSSNEELDVAIRRLDIKPLP